MIVTAASYCIGPCSLSTSMHIIFLKSSVFLIGGCCAGSEVAAMGCVSTQVDGRTMFALIGKTGFV